MNLPSVLLAPVPSVVHVLTSDGAVSFACSSQVQRTVPDDPAAATFEYLLTLDECTLSPPYVCSPWLLTRLIGHSLRVRFEVPGLPEEVLVEGLRLRQVAFTLTGVGLFLDIPVSEPVTDDLSRK